VQILDILFFDMKEIQDVEDVSDESETDSFIEQIYLTRPDTKSQRIVKTFLINFSFIALGLCGSVLGPTLLDLCDVFETSISSLSLVAIIRCVGAMAGSFSAGYILDKYSQHRYIFLFAYTTVMGLSTTMIPFSPSLYFFFGLCGLNGFVSGSLDTGGNVLCLDLWQGFDDSGPYMHSIHFSFGLGAFLAPIIAEKFLREDSMHMNSDNLTERIKAGESITSDPITGPGLEMLYPILGIFSITVSIGYLVFAVKAYKMKDDSESFKISETTKKSSSNNVVIISLILAFLFLYAGMEVIYGTYIATFSVRSELHLLRKIGARITAVFWGSFAAMRFVAIFISMKLNPLGTLLFSFFMSIVGSTLLAIFAETSVIALGILTAFMGIGMAPIYASSMLWMDQYMTVTNKIGGLMTVAAGLGADAFPLILGQFIGAFPMLLMYMQVGLIYFCVVLFFMATWVGKRRNN